VTATIVPDRIDLELTYKCRESGGLQLSRIRTMGPGDEEDVPTYRHWSK